MVSTSSGVPDRPARPARDRGRGRRSREHRVDVVGDEDDRRPRALAAARVEEVAIDPLVREVEREQRLVGEQQRGIGDERLRDAQPLLLAAREPADRRVRVRRRRRPSASARVDPRSLGADRRPKPQRCPSRPSRTRSRPRSGRSRSKTRCCGHVADPCSAARRAPRLDATRPAVGSSRPSRIRSSDVLPVPFGPRTASSSPRLELEARALRQSARVAERGARVRRPRRRLSLTVRARGERARLVELPLLEVEVRRQRLGHADHRDPGRAAPRARTALVIGETAWLL